MYFSLPLLKSKLAYYRLLWLTLLATPLLLHSAQVPRHPSATEEDQHQVEHAEADWQTGSFILPRYPATMLYWGLLPKYEEAIYEACLQAFPESYDLLTLGGAHAQPGETPLHTAARMQDIASVLYLIEDLNVTSDRIDSQGRTPLDRLMERPRPNDEFFTTSKAKAQYAPTLLICRATASCFTIMHRSPRLPLSPLVAMSSIPYPLCKALMFLLLTS